MNSELTQPAGDAAAPPLGGEIFAPAGPLSETLPADYWDVLPEQPRWTEGLSTQHRAFVAAYLNNRFSAVAAAREVGYSEKHGYELRRSPAIVRAIELALMEVGLSRITVIEELSAMAHANLADLMEVRDDGKIVFRSPDSLPEELKRAITRAEVDGETGRIIKVGTDKLAALALLAKILRMTTGSETSIALHADGPIKIILSKEDQQVL